MVFDGLLQQVAVTAEMPVDFVTVVLILRLAIITLIAIDMAGRDRFSTFQQFVLMAGVVILPIIGPVIYITVVLSSNAVEDAELEESGREDLSEEVSGDSDYVETEDTTYACPICGDEFESRRGMHIHRGMEHEKDDE